MSKKVKVIIFIMIFITIFLIISKFLNPVGSTGEWYSSYIITDYYKKKKDTVNVLYVGSSNIYAGISPLEIYEKTGITGYDMSTPEQKVWTSYYELKEAFKTQSPKVVFLESSEFFCSPNDQAEPSIRKAIDPLKWSDNKVDMINDSIYNFSSFDKLSCYVPILRFHSRWSNLTWGDFVKFYNNNEFTYEGYMFNKNVQSYKNSSNKIEDSENEDITDIYKMPEAVRNYLSKIIELCKEKNSELVLISMPTPKIWSQDKHDDVEAFSKAYNLKFIDLNAEENPNIDWTKDSPDEGIHLNIYGAEKVGSFLSTYITKNWSFENHKNDANYRNWDENLEKYNLKKTELKSK